MNKKDLAPKFPKFITSAGLRKNLAAVLKEVATGQEYLVTVNGQPIALIQPVPGDLTK